MESQDHTHYDYSIINYVKIMYKPYINVRNKHRSIAFDFESLSIEISVCHDPRR